MDRQSVRPPLHGPKSDLAILSRFGIDANETVDSKVSKLSPIYGGDDVVETDHVFVLQHATTFRAIQRDGSLTCTTLPKNKPRLHITIEA